MRWVHAARITAGVIQLEFIRKRSYNERVGKTMGEPPLAHRIKAPVPLGVVLCTEPQPAAF